MIILQNRLFIHDIGQDDAIPASNLLDSNNFHYPATVNEILPQNHKITADQELSNGYPEKISINESVKMNGLQEESHTFKVNVNTDLSQHYDQLKENVKANIPEKHEITFVNNQDLKTQNRYINHCNDVDVTNGKDITETSDNIISNGITGLKCNGYSQCKSVLTPPALVSQNTVIGSHPVIENGLTAIQKLYFDSN